MCKRADSIEVLNYLNKFLVSGNSAGVLIYKDLEVTIAWEESEGPQQVIT